MKKDYNIVVAAVMDYSWNIFCDYINLVNCDMKSIHYKTSDGYEEFREYDENGNVIYYKNSYGDEHHCQYNGSDKIYQKILKDGKITHEMYGNYTTNTRTEYINWRGHEYYCTYDNKTNKIISLSTIN